MRKDYPIFQIYKHKMMIGSPQFKAIAQLIIVAIMISNANFESPLVELQLNVVKNFNLKAAERLHLKLKIEQNAKQTQNLFISAESPYNDPFQQPYISVNSTQNFVMGCDDESGSYTGICKIPSSQLIKNRLFFIQVYCVVDCHLSIGAYISQMYKLELGKIIQLSSMATFGLAQIIKVSIPENITFESILILAKIQNYQTAIEGVTVLANYGQNVTAPSQSQFMIKGEPTYGHRIGLSIPSTQIKAGQSIILYIFLGVNNTVQLSAYLINSNTQQISIGSPLVDFVSKGQNKQYRVMIPNDINIQNEDILVKFIIYSGSPDVKISFDANFTEIATQDNWFIESSFVYLLTPELRKTKNFANSVYIKVSSYFLSSYFLQVNINTLAFNVLQNSIMQMVKIEPQVLQNFIFEDENYVDKMESEDNGTVKYKVTVQMRQGSIQFGIRDCDSLHRNSQDYKLENCLIKNLSELRDPTVRKSFNNIQGQLKRMYNTYTITFVYNVSSCPKAAIGTHLERYICDFHMVIHPLVNSQAYLGVQITKYNVPRALIQSVISRDSILQQEYNYYLFYLPSSSNIIKLQFYSTIIDGDIAMLISRKDKYPQFQSMTDQNSDIQLSVQGKIIVDSAQITEGYYYVSIYGYEISDYTLSVAIQRNSTENETEWSQATELRLKKGLKQSYSMNAGQKYMKFIIESIKSQNIRIQINTIEGQISQKVEKKNTNQSINVCPFDNRKTTSFFQCSFSTEESSKYLITIEARSLSKNVFVIGYSDDATDQGDDLQCVSYPVNIPLFLSINLGTEDANCFTYKLHQFEDLQITIAMSDFDKIKSRGLLSYKLSFSNSNRSIQFSTNELIVTSTQVKQLCIDLNLTNTTISNKSSLNPNKNTTDCQLSLIIYSTKNATGSSYTDGDSIQLMVAVQGYNDQNVLFDGIPVKIATNKLSITSPKKFYYFVRDSNSQMKDLNIYLTTQTQSEYQVSARVVTQTVFGRDLEGNQYPKYNDGANNTKIANSSSYTPIITLSIQKQLLRSSYPSSPMIVLISVFGMYPSPQSINSNKQAYVFKLEATQLATSLVYGQSKIGYLDKDQLYEYQLEIQRQISSIITVRPMGTTKCISTYLKNKQFVKESQADQGKIIQIANQFSVFKVFTNQSGTKYILLKGVSDKMCTYQISYNSLVNPIKTVYKNIPYQLKITNAIGQQYFLYFSTTSQSLHFLQLQTSGDSLIYVQPFLEDSTQTIQNLMAKNLNNFKYKGEINANLFVDKDSESYCRNCYYFIVVKGKPIVSGQFIVNVQSTPIPLKQGVILKDRVEYNKTIRYQAYSSIKFSLILNPLYGVINAKIKFPNGQIQQKLHITEQTQVEISSSNLTSSSSSNYFDPNSRFSIQIFAVAESSYFIGIKRDNASNFLFQGVPIYINSSAQTTKLQFSNMEPNKPIKILVQNLYYSQDTTNQISFTAEKINHKGYVDPPTFRNVITKVAKSEGSYNIQLFSQRADYSLRLVSTRPTRISVILAKQMLTHLAADRTVMASDTGIFQIFSPGDSVMIQVFLCSGSIEVSASSNYTKILKDEDDQNVLRMEHANYGGHYVISAQKLKGEYYIKTSNISINNQIISYLISYNLYSPSSGQKQPYKVYSLKSSNIQYSYQPGIIKFSLHKIYRKDQQKSKGESIYTLYIGKTAEEIQKMTSCSIGNPYQVAQVFKKDQISAKNIDQYLDFQIQIKDIQQAIGDSSYYFVSAQAKFSWQRSTSAYVNSVSFVYETSQMLLGNQPEFTNFSKTNNTFFVLLWIVVPFLIGSFVFYLAIKYFVNSIRQGPNQLIEQEQGGQSQEVFDQKNNKKPSNANVEGFVNADKYSIQ